MAAVNLHYFQNRLDGWFAHFYDCLAGGMFGCLVRTRQQDGFVFPLVSKFSEGFTVGWRDHCCVSWWLRIVIAILLWQRVGYFAGG